MGISDGIRFDGRVVLVTGAGRGLGAAYAHAFAARGATVVVHDAGVALDGSGGDAGVADAVAAAIGAAGGAATASHEDLRSASGCEALVEHVLAQHGRLDAVVHNAGLLVFEGIEQAARSWEAVLATTLDAAFHVTRAAWPAMKAQQYGRLVFTTSGRGMRPRDAVAGLAADSAGKMGEFGLMLAAAAEGAPHGIRANAIAPVAAALLQRRVEPRELDPELVAPGVLFLASERCDVSGTVLRAAGGTFGIASWENGPELELGTGAAPEAIAKYWHELEGVTATA